MRLVERDYEMFIEIERWRFCLGRHLSEFLFSCKRTCDRRTKTLIDADYLERRKIIYGVASIYSLTYKAKMLIGANKRQDKVRVDRIIHDIAVIDTAIYFVRKFGISLKDITTEKQLHSKNGFSVRNHYPDFIFTKDDKTTCVEVELTLKAKGKFEKNIRNNFLTYDAQVWVCGTDPRISGFLEDSKMEFSNIEIMKIEEVKKYVSELNGAR